MWGAFSEERTGLSFTIVPGPRQRSHFWVRIQWGWWPYFTVSDSRLPFSSPHTTRRVTVEVFDPTFTRDVSLTESESKSESYITADGQSASLSWNKDPILGLRPDLYYCQTVAGFLTWSALSDERTGLSFAIAACPRHRSHFRVQFSWDSWLVTASAVHILKLDQYREE
jgi:hypothetical protein